MTSTNVPATKEGSQAPATTGGPKTIRDFLEGDLFKEQLAKALPKHLTPDRFIRVAVTAMNKTPLLMQCDQASFFNALLSLSQLGLEPDGRRAHLIPFRNNSKNITECQLIVDYKGLVELIQNTGDVSFIHADVVCEKDEFVYDKGVLAKHVINFKEPRGNMYAAYALIRFKDGTEKVEVMTKDEIDAVRKRSRAANSGPWVTDYNEMAKKTAFRRASKWVKLAPEQRDLIEADDDAYAPVPDKPTSEKLSERMAASISDHHALPTPEGLTGSRLEIYTKAAEMAAGDMLEQNNILRKLSNGKVSDKQTLIDASEDTIKEITTKMFGGKK